MVLSRYIAPIKGKAKCLDVICRELRQQGGEIVHKKTHYAKVDGAKCCNEAMAHRNHIVCQSEAISRAVRLFAGKSGSRLLATQPRQRQLLLAPAMAGSCGPEKQAWQTEKKARGSLRAFGLVLIFPGGIFVSLKIPEDAAFPNWDNTRPAVPLPSFCKSGKENILSCCPQ